MAQALGVDLPAGFTVDQPAPQPLASLPPGFEIDQPAANASPIAALPEGFELDPIEGGGVWDQVKAGAKEAYAGIKTAAGISRAENAGTLNAGNALSVARTGMTPERLDNISSPKSDRELDLDRARGDLQQADRLYKEAASVPYSPATQELLGASDFGGVWDAFKKSPVTIIKELGTRSAASSAVSLAPAAAAGAMGGPLAFAAGAGVGSGSMEYAASIRDGLQREGVDIENPDAILRATGDAELMDRVRQYAGTRGAIIGTFDAATGGIASKTLAPKVIAKPLVREAINVGAQMGVQAGGGAAGEAAAQYATTGEVRPGEVAAEALGEMISAPADVAGATMTGVRERVKNSPQTNQSAPEYETQPAGLPPPAPYAVSPDGTVITGREQTEAPPSVEPIDLIAQQHPGYPNERPEAIPALPPPVMQVTPEGQAITPEGQAEYAAQQAAAAEQQRIAQQQAVQRQHPGYAIDVAPRGPAPDVSAMDLADMSGGYEGQQQLDQRNSIDTMELVDMADVPRAPSQVSRPRRPEESYGSAPAQPIMENALNEPIIPEVDEGQDILDKTPVLPIPEPQIEDGETQAGDADAVPVGIQSEPPKAAEPAPLAPETREDIAPETLSIEGEYRHSKHPEVTAIVSKTEKGYQVEWAPDDVQEFRGKNAAEKVRATLAREQYAPSLDGVDVSKNEPNLDASSERVREAPKNIPIGTASADQPASSVSVDTVTAPPQGVASPIDVAAHEAATSPFNDLPEPTEAMKEAGNYRMGHVRVHGLDISIENPRGSERTGRREDGSIWSHTLSHHYGYFRKTEAADGEHVDVYVGPNPESEKVFVIDQINQKDGAYDEAKVMLGFSNRIKAVNAYKSNFDKGWKVGAVTPMSISEFKEWLKGDTSKPLSQEPIKDAGRANTGRQQIAPASNQEKIDDLGEKIGGARKDTAAPTGARGKRTSADDEEAGWRKRYITMQIVDGRKDAGKWMLADKRRAGRFGGVHMVSREVYDTEAEALAQVPMAEVARNHRVAYAKDAEGKEVYYIARDVSDRKRVRVVSQDFNSREAAMEYMAQHAVEIIETKTSFGEEILPRPEKVMRTGAQRRSGDVGGNDFISVFGFRGVEFGNWNNQDERQEVMNHAYDGLLDLADVLGVPPMALSLNGDLALAFGARGQGLTGASAHYEREYGVINLTKMSGAGSLAHEFAHALDHYLGRLDGKAKRVDAPEPGKPIFKASKAREDDYASHGFSSGKKYEMVDGAYRATKEDKSGVRAELREAWDSLIKTMTVKAEQFVEDAARAEKFAGKVRTDLERRLADIRAGLAEQKDEKYWKRHAKPATEAQLKEFDALADKLLNGSPEEQDLRAEETKGGRGFRMTNDALNGIAAIMKKVRNRSGFGSGQTHGPLDYLRSDLTSYHVRLKMLQSAASEETKTRTIPTNFVMDAKDIDQGRASDYWTMRHELVARAFEAFVHDKLAAQGNQSDFLVYGTTGVIPTPWGFAKPYPTGDERTAINAAFEKFFEVVETEPTPKGVRMFNLENAAKLPAGATPRGVPIGQVKLIVEAFFKKYPGGKPANVRVHRNSFGAFGSAAARPEYSGVKAFYEPDTDTLEVIASNHNDARDVRSSLQHEILVHKGLGLFPQEQIDQLILNIERAAQHDSALKEIWDEVNQTYADDPAALRTEEVLARVAQRRLTMLGRWWSRVINAVRNMLRSVGWIDDSVSITDLREVIYTIGDAFRQGKRAHPRNLDSIFNNRAQDTATSSADQFSAENRRIREEDVTLWAKSKALLQRGFAPGGLLPDPVFRAKIDRDSNMQADEFDTAHAIAGLERAVKATWDKTIPQLSPQWRAALQEGLSGRLPHNMPEPIRGALVAMRQQIDTLSKQYVGILQQQAEELAANGDLEGAAERARLLEIISGNIGQYVHRSYRVFDDPKWFSNVPDDVLNNARGYLLDRYRQMDMTEAEARRRAEVTINEILKTGTAYESLEAFIKESKLGAKDLSTLQKKKEIAPEIRALMGEYDDARVNFAKSATKMSRLIWNQRFLDAVREKGMGAFLWNENDRPANATTKIAGDQSEVYAPLNGLWTTPEVAQAMKDALGKERLQGIMKYVIQANGMLKYGKTVLSPTTAMRNFQSSLFVSLANGHFDMRHAVKSLHALREHFAHTEGGKHLEYMRELKRLGVIYDSPYAEEMMRMLADSRLESFLQGKSARAFETVRAMNDFAQKFYSFGDDFWKIIGFENEKTALIRAGMTEQEAKMEAAERIRNTYPTYSMVGKAITWLARTPLVGTFVAFPAEIIRTSINMGKYVVADMKAGRKELAARRAIGMATAAGFAYAIQALSMAALGMDDDDDEAVREMAAPWSKNSSYWYLGRDEKGAMRYVDMTFLDPYSYWKRPIMAMMREQPADEAVADAAGEMLSPFLGIEIGASVLLEVVANKKQSGGKVYNETDDSWQQTADIAKHLGKGLQPGIAKNLQDTAKAAAGERSKSGKQYTWEDEAAAWLGWRATTQDPKTALYFRAFSFEDAQRAAGKRLRDVLTDPNKIGSNDVADAKAEANQQLREAYRSMGLVVDAASKSGLSRGDIARVLKSSGLSHRDIILLLNGKSGDIKITPDMLQKARQKASAIYGKEEADKVAERYREAMKR